MPKIIQSKITQKYTLQTTLETITYFTQIKVNYLKYTHINIFNQYTFSKMTFDSHSLQRLKELGRKLPKEISRSQPYESSNPQGTNKPKLHPVEIETNPEQLFRELMEISPDGNVPPHLLERLKKIESNSLKISSNSDPLINKNSQDLSTNESLNLYTQFKQFLLEDDCD
tara:strand:+ start:1006 stop:1515 length:510 start_codon:yes stop_codon:yes gene_type:complete